jgi:hypothetical protein
VLTALGDLATECSAALTAVLEALGKKRGTDDDTSEAQRFHDALKEACVPLSARAWSPVGRRPGQPSLPALSALP